MSLSDSEDWQQVIPDIPARAEGLALDETAEKIYWVQQTVCLGCTDMIRRANFDGSDQETLVTTEAEPSHALEIAIDPVEQKMY